ncbi:MAG TPA: TRAP transporter large permease [Xanthobacteraceae bacterium]|jgi:C4-dicarboxylate transporter DctM subunit|nr:TRAP transporter large permease [Xanthobacteraceae bacterium]
MSPELQIVLTFAVFLVLLTCGMAVPFAIAVPAVFYLLLQGGLPSLNSLGLVSWGSMNSFVLTCVPLFMLMAEILRTSGLSRRIYSGLSKLVARLPGGLLQTNIAGCAVFASVSGSSIATAASIGGVALPQLIERKYDRPLAAGSLAAGGTLGILLPPSFGMIVYGTFTETSVPKLFMTGVAPGLIMTAAFMLYIGVHATIAPHVAPREQGPRSLSDFICALADVLPFAVLIAGTLGGIYAGLVTTTEGATIGCCLAILLGAVVGDLTWRGLLEAMCSTVKFSGNILFIIFAAYVFSYAISFAGVGEKVTRFIVDLHLSRLEFFFALFVLYTILGCLIESLGMIVITVPLIFPVLPNYGIDPLLFGVVLVLFVELGQISPPIGINLFVIQSIWDGKLSDVVLGTIPFHLTMFVVLAIIIIWPDIALWLPHHMTR